MTGFDEAIALSPSGDGTWSGVLDRDWWGASGPHGGYLAAITASATAAVADSRHILRSLTLHYLEAGTPGPIEVRCAPVRATRGATTVQLTMHQGDRAVLVAVAALMRPRESAQLAGAEMPLVPPYAEVPVSRAMLDRGVMDVAPTFARELEYRHCIGPEPLSGGSDLVTGGWLRFRQERPLDSAAAALMMDAWWPAVWSGVREVPRTPTVDLTIHFRRSLPPTSDPVIVSFRSHLGADGLVDEEGELWSADGELLVQSRQLAVLIGVHS